MINKLIPDVIFKTRVRDELSEEVNPFKWELKSTSDYFEGKKNILFSLPGAFTPTCSSYQLPDFEALHEDFSKHGIEDIFCISVNDAFVMNKWGDSQKINKVKLIPDGSGEFTRRMGMLIAKDNLGFGLRSWRYAAIIDNKKIINWFEEPGISDNCKDDPYGETSPQNILSSIS